MINAAASLPQTRMNIPQPTPQRRPEADEMNVGQLERVASVMVGSLLVARGIKQMSLLGLAVAGLGAALVQRGATGKCPVYKALNVTTAEETGKWLTHPLSQHIRVEQSVMVNRPLEEVYTYWRKLENLPTFMEHLESVNEIDAKRSHWVARAPAGRTVQWNADIVADEPNRRIAWKSVEGSDVETAGQVLFEPEGKETRVRVVLEYSPPAGVLGAVVAKLFGEEPSQTVKEDLRRFKQMMEAGEVPTIEGQPQRNGK
jgi:uncharacterized membrane protein